MSLTFEKLARLMELTYGVQYDREEGFFICPECAEPIYAEDWSQEDLEEGCPICEFAWFD